MPKRDNSYKQHVRKAYKRAEALGELIDVEPASRHGADGSPLVGEGQVYATRTGTVYHPLWCQIVADKWDNDPKGLHVIELATVGARRECRQCQTERGV